MFIELHLSENDEKIMININRINSVYLEGGTTYIYVEEVVYRVKESYEDIAETIKKVIFNMSLTRR